MKTITNTQTVERSRASDTKRTGRLFFLEASGGRIHSANADGSNRKIIVTGSRTVLWLLSLGIFDKAYAKATADSTDEHKYMAPDLFTAETPLGTYQGMTDQIVLSRTPGAYRTVLVPRGSSKPEWLSLRK